MRIAIISETETLPLTRTYAGNTQQIIRIAELLNRWVLSQAPDLIKQSIRASLAVNRRVDAVMTLRRHYPLPMEQARSMLDNPEKLDALPATLPSADDVDIDTGDKETLLGIVALITLVAGPVLLILGVMDTVKGNATQSWLPTDAVITYSGLHREIESYERKFYLQYRYQVNNTRYQSNVLYIGSTTYSVIPRFYLEDRDEINPADYRTGDSITIFYDPQEPRSSVVLPGVHGGTRAQIVAGIAGLLIYVYLAKRDLCRRARIKAKKTHTRYGTP